MNTDMIRLQFYTTCAICLSIVVLSVANVITAARLGNVTDRVDALEEQVKQLHLFMSPDCEPKR